MIIFLLMLLFNHLAFASEQPEVIVFVSFSMPEVTLKAWMKEALNYNASMNIRGLIGNNFPQTIAIVQKLIKENDNQGGINIDPELFDEYGITKVPAVVVREKEKFDVVYGTSSIKEAFRIIQEKV